MNKRLTPLSDAPRWRPTLMKDYRGPGAYSRRGASICPAAMPEERSRLAEEYLARLTRAILGESSAQTV